ncbi:Na/Pi symporter [Parendozoicomonas haliclonae]|uniref:Na+/Pi-cotransporter n=1 Tax=Parendozoicomonas haliclonae TaxID=1960125 RepID=A0A1X7AK59_9GAMM|nr:Na/Pi symporter [Parendozoicomonas haliclonae]SMA47578.1 Na+/Pi-cotransporter [Parendozoicomonas haliclonae]
MQATQTVQTGTTTAGTIRQWATVIAMVYLLLLAVGMIGSGFKWASGGAEGARQLFAFASNPVMGLVIGTFATALIQSSSTVTSVIVGLVAGGLPVATAIPMIMGANIGTTVTNTMVSMGHISKRKEFRRAFSAATIHDFFNLLAVAIFLPMEIATGYLGKVSEAMAGWFYGGSADMDMSGLDFIKPITKPVVGLFKDMFEILPGIWGGVALALLGLAFVFISIMVLGKVLKKLMVGRAKEVLHKAIGGNPLKSMASGTLVTVAVQSSSTSTSLIVPLAGNGIFKLKEVYPFTLGCNIGTCVTALMAALSVSGAMAEQSLQIAFVHLMFNISATVVIYGIPFLRNIPYLAARTFAQKASRNRSIVFGYVIGVFFILPAALILLTR